jgi:acetyl-CoA synthetase
VENIIWNPYGDYIDKSNIARYMKKHRIEDYCQLIDRSTSDIEWFWEAALCDMEMEWG